jgi:hypothetical protein
MAGGRFYNVEDPMNIPEIFIKEAQTVRRAMIIEETFSPQMVYALSETVSGLSVPLPALDGYVLTGPKEGLNQLVLTSHQADPILATCQSGLGRCVAFTSTADSRWAAQWMQWSDFSRFWEQVVRWTGKPAQSADCEVFTDVQGHDITVNVEALDAEGRFLQLAMLEGQVISPQAETYPLSLNQTGPGRYAGRFQAPESGSYIVNLQHRRDQDGAGSRLTNAIVTIPYAPEFRDFTDNMPLLEEISKITGGRILPSDPNQANLYDYAGLRFPQTDLPLLGPLMLAWIALFLLDVAVRRVVLDFKAGFRRVRSWVLAVTRRAETDETISRLQARRHRLREQWSARSAAVAASRRYDRADDYEGDLIDDKPARAAQTTEPQRPEAPARPAPGKPQGEGSHIDKLLRAKRKSAERSENPRGRADR